MAKENEDGSEKTEQPTTKRKSKARQDGNVAKSQDVNVVAGLFVGLIYLLLMGPTMAKSLALILKKIISQQTLMEVNQGTMVTLLKNVLTDVSVILMPFFTVLVAAALLSNLSQIGFLFTTKVFEPKFDKFNPVKGMKKFFKVKQLVTILQQIAKLFAVALPPYFIIKAEMNKIPLIMDMGTWAIISYIGITMIKIILAVAFVLLLIAIYDLYYTRKKHTEEIMMTKQEVKDERKNAEGDPKVKARIRRLQLEEIRKRMMTSVPQADVVITNPTSLAIALKYDRSISSSPVVVAKGARLIAEKIKQVARENNVPVIENKPLAQSLFKMVEIGESIPEELYKAVASVLAYVYNQKNNKQAVNN